MLSDLSEKRMHTVRWVIWLAWMLLIVSLFYDPVSAALTHPDSSWSPLADPAIAIANNPAQCVNVQNYCILLTPYPIGTRVFWGMVVPSAIFVVLVFGHEFWRRICPLYFFSQFPRAIGEKLGFGPLLKIESNQWLQRNHFYVQFVLFYLGITGRILLVNSVRPATAILFITTMLAAAVVVALYGGRSWCHYVCPFGMVQTVFTGPRGLLDSQAHRAAPYSITQSMCRSGDSSSIDQNGSDQSACISCKSACMDIDSEQSYWQQMHQPGRQLVQYGYLGLVVGYFCYYALYAGNFRYYFSGVWSHEKGAIASLSKPGFYLLGHAINIPKLVAAPLTLATFAMLSYGCCKALERFYRGYLKQQAARTATSIDPTLGRHRAFSLCTFLAFNIFFIYGGRPELNNLPLAVQLAFQALIGMVSSLWLYRTWYRSPQQYEQERTASTRRRSLKKLPLDFANLLPNRTLDDLSAQEVELLAQTLPQVVKPDISIASTPVVPLPRTQLKRSGSSRHAPKPQVLKAPIPKTQISKTQASKIQASKTQASKPQSSQTQARPDVPTTGLPLTRIRKRR